MHSYDTLAVLSQSLFSEVRRQPGLRFQNSTLFLRIFLCQTSYSNFWLDRKFQASAQTLSDITFSKVPLNFPLGFCFNILTFVPIYSCAVVQTINKLHEHEFLWFGRNVSQHQTGRLLLLTISELRQLTHEVDTRTVFMLSTFIRSLCDSYFIMNWKCQERSVSDVIRCVIIYCSNEIQNEWI